MEIKEEKAKYVSESISEQAYLVRDRYLNGSGRLFGGSLLAWIDEIGAMTARRHCNCHVTTAAIDNLQFKKAVYHQQTVVLIAKMTHVGNSSMEVRVDTYTEDLDGTREIVNRAYLVFVALKDNMPVRVPRLITETEEQKIEWAGGEKRAELRKQRRKEGF